MNRRRLLVAGCACGAALCARFAGAQTWTPPARFARPQLDSDEAGMWSMMDREETRLKRSPFLVRDAKLQAYLQDIACWLAGDHCPDIRVHLVRAPEFNASMSPNGMMQLCTGLMLRMENEAQLAAVMAHEIGHYVERHMVDRLRDTKDRAALARFVGIFGIVGRIGSAAVVASGFAYSRDQERAADTIGVALMRNAGYDPTEAAKVWQNLLIEANAREAGEADSESFFFATHPAPAERRQALEQLAQAKRGGVVETERWRGMTGPHLREWLAEEVKRARHEQALALITRLIERSPGHPEFLFARGEVLRSRARSGDLDAALADYESAVRAGNEPAETHRGMGLVFRQQQQTTEALASFRRYLELAPGAPDALLIKGYMDGA